MPRIAALLCIFGLGCCAPPTYAGTSGALPEFNPVNRSPVSIGPEASRLIVGFRPTPSNAVTRTMRSRVKGRSFSFTQASTSSADVANLATRSGLAMAKSRQITSSTHVVFLKQRLYGTDVESALAKLRADSAVQFAVIDRRRYVQSAVTPDDPLFQPTPGMASGQWYMLAPNPTVVVEGVSTSDLSSTDAVDAWSITTGSSGIVIADVDTGVLFDHPDLLRAGLGGRLLPGYDFVGEDFNPNSPYNGLGTFLIANDGDGWDPDPSDPGDWITNSDLSNSLFAGDTAGPSSWHGTRVVGILGALTDNGIGIAGMTRGSWILPVRALGKGGGYDSDILAGIQWAAGLSVTNPDGSAVPDNPYPADIINLSLGGDTTSCSSQNGAAYESALTTVTGMGVLVVISAGNSNVAGVELPGNCAGVVPGVMAVAGLRNVGTKVGFSSFGPEVSLSAPAGNCINVAAGSNCLRSIDTTTDLGAMGPLTGSSYTYTNEQNPNLGTSFAAPIVSGIAALMRSVNGNLTPAQVAARMQATAAAFPPNTGNLPVCPSTDDVGANATFQCSCPPSGQCGSGMVNALSAVNAALNPIAVISATGNTMFDAGGSVAACNLSVASYAWVASGGISITAGAAAAQVTVLSTGSTGTLTLTVKDSAGHVDTGTVSFTAAGVATVNAPTSAGTSATACPTPLTITPAPPTVTQAFSPASVGENVAATLTITFTNTNGFALTQSGFTETAPANLVIQTSPAPTTTCGGALGTLTSSARAVTLADANIPANGSCTITMSVKSATAGGYTNSIAAQSLMTAPAGGNAASAAAASLTVTAPSKGGGGAWDWWDTLLVVGVLLAGRRYGRRPTAALVRRSRSRRSP